MLSALAERQRISDGHVMVLSPRIEGNEVPQTWLYHAALRSASPIRRASAKTVRTRGWPVLGLLSEAPLKGQRRMVDQIFRTWNQTIGWLIRIDGLRRAALSPRLASPGVPAWPCDRSAAGIS